MRAERELELATPRTVHIVAIGGSAMSGIASVLVRMGHRVSGSDIRESPRLQRLRDLGVVTHLGHDAANVGDDVDALIVSTAIGDDNPEVLIAGERGIPVYRRADAQRAIVAMRRGIAVAGSHGKTTTASMLTLILRAAGWDPSFLIGGDVPELGTTAALHAGEWLVVEADESDGSFLEIGAEAAVVTSIEPDHLSYYGDVATMEAAFERFVAGVTGVRVLCIDDPVTAALAASLGDEVVTYGFAAGADHRITDYAGSGTGARFALERRGGTAR